MAKMTAFRAEYGVSVELKGSWHRFTCAIEIECENGDEPAEVKKKAWNTVVNEVEKKIAEVIE